MFTSKNKILFLSLSLLLYVFYPHVTWGQITDTVKIMPLGNSITKGYTGSPTHIGYRQSLYDSLTNAGYSVLFVGFNHAAGGTDPWDHEEAYGGWQAVQSSSDITYNKYDMSSHLMNNYADSANTANGELNTKLTNYNPAIILLHVGTNDLDVGTTAAEGVTHVDSILKIIYSPTYNNNDTSIVFLAQIINRSLQVTSPPNIRAITSSFNDQLRTLAVNRIINGDRLTLVNMETAITNYNETSGDMYDSYHPNQTGYDKMAGAWYKALKSYFIDKPLLICPLAASSYEGITDTLVWGLTQNAASYLLQISKNDSTFSPSSLVYNVGDGTITDRYKILTKSNIDTARGFLSSTKYYWRVRPLNSSTITIGSYSDTLNFTTSPLYVSATVFLQGPYAGGDTMHTKLDSLGLIPKAQPYSGAPWHYNGGESVTTVPANIVDWVLVALRDSTDSASTVARRAAFLKSDGSIVDTDGVSPINFSGIPFGNYYIVIRHRNHLSVMSPSAVSLASGTLAYDFTSGNAYGGTSGMVALGGGKYGMIAGDASADGGVFGEDYTSYQLSQGMKGYKSADFSMDGGVFGEDYTIYQLNQGKKTSVPQ